MRLTIDKAQNIVNESVGRILSEIMGRRVEREAHYDENGNEIPEFEDNMNDPKKYVPFDMAHKDWSSVGKPTGWRALYLKARRNWTNSSVSKMRGDSGDMGDSLDKAWQRALKAEYPNPSERAKAFNDFAKKIDAFRGYEPQIYDNVQDDDPNAAWNKKGEMESKEANKKLVKITEDDLHQIVEDSVKRIFSSKKKNK